MGKRQGPIAGLARFLNAFDDTSASASTSDTHAVSTQLKAPLDNTSKDNTETTPISSVTVDLKRANHSRTSQPSKKQKTGLLGPGKELYDATELVPRYTHASQVPEHLQKYFAQRTRFFSLYDRGCLLDDEGWYSVTPERIAEHIAERCRSDVILDAFCGVGGNAIAFAQTCQRVITFDISPTRLALARHNATVYGVADRIEFVLGDFVAFARSQVARRSQQRKFDVIFLSPPWGGPAYLSGNGETADQQHGGEATTGGHPEFGLSSVQPIHGRDLFKLSRKLTPNVAYYLPRNTRLAEVSALLEGSGTESAVGGYPEELVEVEEQWMGNKLKALTCYFGGLVEGQEHLWNAEPLSLDS